jgi:hypothetical protein
MAKPSAFIVATWCVGNPWAPDCGAALPQAIACANAVVHYDVQLVMFQSCVVSYIGKE